MTSRTELRSPYMEFARLSKARYQLGASGVQGMTVAELGARIEHIALNSAGGGFGYGPLLERIAHYCGVECECVVPANGCSMANHLAFAAIFEPGDDVLVEEPTYELLLGTLQFLGVRIRRFPRRYEQDFRIDLRELERQLTPRTRLIVLCNLHNPSSAMVDEPTLLALGALAREAKARVLVDEVYLEAIFPRPQTAALLGPEFVVTSSLTKAYGLGGLRCGWILAEPELARRIFRMNDLFGVHQPHPGDCLSVLAFDRMDSLVARTRNLLDTNRALALEFLRTRTELECFVPEHGTTLFPRLKHGDVNALAERLLEKYDTQIVPGSYFELPQHFRLGLGMATESLSEGLKRLGAALDELSCACPG